MAAKLDKRKLRSFIKKALHEDVRDGDHTSRACIPSRQKSKAKLLVKDKGVLAGVAIAKEIFTYLDPKAKIEVIKDDGAVAKYGDISFYLSCNSQALLMGERLALNVMQRLSGVATLSRKFHNATKKHNVTILDTRKTTPLLRFLEKWAVTVGGCSNYRDGLYDRIMIKDNHVEAAGSITKAVQKANRYLKKSGLDLDMTVEVRNHKELKEVLALKGNPRVMLDNFELKDMKKAVKLVGDRLEVEASGGIKLNNVKAVAATGVDFISVGALTHSAQSLDLSLKIID